MIYFNLLWLIENIYIPLLSLICFPSIRSVRRELSAIVLSTWDLSQRIAHFYCCSYVCVFFSNTRSFTCSLIVLLTALLNALRVFVLPAAVTWHPTYSGLNLHCTSGLLVAIALAVVAGWEAATCDLPPRPRCRCRESTLRLAPWSRPECVDPGG